MKYLVILLVLIPSISFGNEDYVEQFYKEALVEVKEFLPQSIAEEVTLYALLRQKHEDGNNREPEVSINGMVAGGLNKRVMNRLDPEKKGVELKVVRAHDGQTSYALYGSRANLLSTAAIGMLFDLYVHNFGGFSQKDRIIWERSKSLARLMEYGLAKPRHKWQFRRLEKDRKRIISKCNRIYGPCGKAIEKRVEELEEKNEGLFDN